MSKYGSFWCISVKGIGGRTMTKGVGTDPSIAYCGDDIKSNIEFVFYTDLEHMFKFIDGSSADRFFSVLKHMFSDEEFPSNSFKIDYWGNLEDANPEEVEKYLKS